MTAKTRGTVLLTAGGLLAVLFIPLAPAEESGSFD